MSDIADTPDNPHVLNCTTEIVVAYAANNAISSADLPKLIADTYAALASLQNGKMAEPIVILSPAVPVKKSITSDFLICLEDGKKFKSLKRHLASHYGMTPEQYREKWSLPQDYPMTAPSYSATRSALAKANGLGRKSTASAVEAKPAKTPRKKLGLKFG